MLFSLWPALALLLYFWKLLSIVLDLPILLLTIVASSFLPVVMALPDERPFPDITFKIFSQFVKENFSSKISLSTVLLVLFTMTENTDVLSLHARQKNPVFAGEKASISSGWIRGLARALYEKVGDNRDRLFKKQELNPNKSDYDIIGDIGAKLDELATVLGLVPYNSKGNFQGKLKPISHKAFESAQVICPNAVVCEMSTCIPRSLLQITRSRDIPRVTLIRGTTIYENVQLLAGQCPTCETIYYADHERVQEQNIDKTNKKERQKFERIYLNSAKFLKVGQSLWVDRVFSNGVLNGMYSFHASASAYTEYWNNSFWKGVSTTKQLSRRQVWDSFVQESIRTIAEASNRTLQLQDGLSINELTKEAFQALGENGIIAAADQHICGECTQKYKKTADFITGDDPAAVAGIDNHLRSVPIFIGERPSQTFEPGQHTAPSSENDMDVDSAPVKLVVLDGLLVGPAHCAFDGCESELANARGGVFCDFHQSEYGSKCRVRGCSTQKITNTQACQLHQQMWTRHVANHNRHTYAGAKRMLRAPEENLPWQSASSSYTQAHDESAPEAQRKHYFTASRFYCVETICAPCGVVIAWTKFDKAESPTNILQFLEKVYPTEELRPDYICIDKACLVLRTALANGSWDRVWKSTSRFIVDSYHYINHRTTDYMCRKWCNPAPKNGSAPNLVVVDHDDNGHAYYKRAFNTQV